MMIAYNLTDFGGFITGEINASKQFLGNRRSIFLLGFSIIISKFLFRWLYADIVQQGRRNDNVIVTIHRILHDLFSIFQDFQGMRYPSEIISEVIDQQLCDFSFAIVHNWLSFYISVTHRHNALANPAAAPPKTSHVVLILNRNRSKAATRPSTIVNGSIMDARPNCHVTAAIRPSAVTFTPSSRPLIQEELRK